MAKFFFNAFIGLATAAFCTGTARYFGLDAWVFSRWGDLASSSQLTAIALMIGGGMGMIVLVSALVFHWDDKLGDLWHGHYDRDAVRRLREIVKNVQQEWMMFPCGVSEPDRHRMLKRLLDETDDFVLDRRLRPSVQGVRTAAIRMVSISEASYAVAFGLTEQQTWLATVNAELQVAAVELLKRTHKYAIYD